MKKRTLTLLEIMIVILLITLITGVLSYNMKGTLDKGKAFRTERAMEQIRELLLLRQAETGKSMTDIISKYRDELKSTGLVKDPDRLVKDGWGIDFEIKLKGKNDLIVRSERLSEYQSKHHLTARDQSAED